jgi:hypothetical protein
MHRAVYRLVLAGCQSNDGVGMRAQPALARYYAAPTGSLEGAPHDGQGRRYTSNAGRFSLV